ncbi:MAG: Cna B-type domain-containing protein [Lachnospiraceae bacterium]|nr:Cna B-type domain-containing protein [Lachnospiraceae bacterium]
MRKILSSHIYNLIVAVVTLILLVLELPSSVFAAGDIDLSKKGSLELTYQYQEELIDGVPVRIYRVAEIDSVGNFSLLPPYNDVTSFPVTDLNEIEIQSEWDDMLNPIEAYIYTNKIAPTASAITDSKGIAKFENLDLGLYLVIADSVVKGYCTYTFSSFFMSVPTKDADGNWVNAVYDVIAVPKCEKYETEVPKEVEYNLYKRWDDDGHESVRPTSIEVSIYKDGTLYKTVTLSSENSWHYSWKSEPGHSWTMAEPNLTRYTMKLTLGDNSFTLTNTYSNKKKKHMGDNDETPPGDTVKITTPPSVGERILSPIAEVLGEIFGPESDVLGERKLPQTGQLWWPVFVLMILGVISFIYGFITDRINDR